MKLSLYFHTLKHLTFRQVFYQVFYRLRNKIWKFKEPKWQGVISELKLEDSIPAYTSYEDNNQFTFLNSTHQFTKIDWNFSEYGKLWTYNLCYFEYLNQSHFPNEEGIRLIHDIIANKPQLKDAYEPYPISLRAINWVKFLSRHGIKDEKIDRQLYNDLYRLQGQLEYHILANHLFENGFGLLFGAYYFQDDGLYRIAKKIIRSQLKEQILPDGAHYELTPMYHQIILYRILDCYQLVSKNAWKSHELTVELKETASKMLGWLKNMQFSSGELPLVNDSTNNIAPTPAELYSYAEKLGISVKSMPLNESGYRFFRSENLELLMDVGQIAPSYQPGHSHADSLQFILYNNGTPIIVDTGISTYEKNERRQLERSTCSHNTITVNKENSSQVWSGFRVGKRAHVKILEENNKSIVASHDGYRAMGVSCLRKIQLHENLIAITDTVSGKTKGKLIEGHLHFHPTIKIEKIDNEFFLNQEVKLVFPDNCSLEIKEYSFCQGFNQLIPASKIIYTFQNENTFTIQKA